MSYVYSRYQGHETKKAAANLDKNISTIFFAVIVNAHVTRKCFTQENIPTVLKMFFLY